ncbi:MAG: hypothetical protein ACRDMX_16270 [Solirubrobacteraceae bacterium]
MGRRRRQRARAAERSSAPTEHGGREAALVAEPGVYSDDEAGVLTLRGSLTLGARRDYATVLAGGLHRDDARQRAIELLYERLAVTWTIHGVAVERQRELLGRYRMATPAEREFVLRSLRAHLDERFPELEAP